MRQHADQCGDAVGISLQDRLLLGQYRFTGRRRGDVGVAVAVATDPAAETDHGWQIDAMEMRVVVVGALYRPFEAAVHDGDRVEQRTFEVMHAHADLVAHIGARWAHLVRLPQCLDVGAQAPDVGFFVVDRGRRCVQGIDGFENAPHLQHDRTSFRFRRMCREDRHVAYFFEQVLQLVGRYALLAQLAQAGIERALPQHATFGGNATALTVLVAFLGGVDELEVDAERANDRAQGVG